MFVRTILTGNTFVGYSVFTIAHQNGQAAEWLGAGRDFAMVERCYVRKIFTIRNRRRVLTAIRETHCRKMAFVPELSYLTKRLIRSAGNIDRLKSLGVENRAGNVMF